MVHTINFPDKSKDMETNTVVKTEPVDGEPRMLLLSLFEWMTIAEKRNYCCACGCNDLLGPDAVIVSTA